MYTVTITTYLKKGMKQIEEKVIPIGSAEDETFENGMDEMSEYIFGLDIEYDEIEGADDIVVDDLLIDAAEGECFEAAIESGKYKYIITGEDL